MAEEGTVITGRSIFSTVRVVEVSQFPFFRFSKLCPSTRPDQEQLDKHRPPSFSPFLPPRAVEPLFRDCMFVS